MSRPTPLLVALALDLAFGELPHALHPVVAMGRWLNLGERLAPSQPGKRLVWGASWLIGGIGLSAGLAALVAWRCCRSRPFSGRRSKHRRLRAAHS